MRQSFVFALFFSLYFLIYGGMHVYVYFKLRSALGPGLKWTVFYGLLSLFMVIGARALWVIDLGAFPALRKVLSCSGYMWMAFIFMVFSAFVVVDLVRLLLWVADGIMSSRFGDLLSSARLRAAAAVGLALVICVYGWFEALNVRTVRIAITTPKLPEGVERVRVAHISDVHLGWIIQEERLASMLDRVKEASPDMLVITGDLVDGDMEERAAEAALFRNLDFPGGIYGVTGNHEYHAGIGQALAFMEHSGIRVLRNEAVRAGSIVVAGVDDRVAPFYGGGAVSDGSVLAGVDRDSFVLFLKHQPVIDPDAVGLFDLQLSGHTHGGQIWPFSLATRIINKTKQGLWAIVPRDGRGQAHAEPAGKRSMIYISNGAGTWGSPVRFLAPPEITIFDIVREPGARDAGS